MFHIVPGYVAEIDSKKEVCGEVHITKKTIHINNKRITPKECRLLCDSDMDCKYFFIYYNPYESATRCITYKSCAQRESYTFAGTTYRKVNGNLVSKCA